MYLYGVKGGHVAKHVRYRTTTRVSTELESPSLASWMHTSQARLSLAAQRCLEWRPDSNARLAAGGKNGRSADF